MDAAHKYIAFRYSMFPEGTHLLNVFVTCDHDPAIINVGVINIGVAEVYSLYKNVHTTFVSGPQCLELQTRITTANSNCNVFTVSFLGIALGTEGMRIEDITFVADTNAPECGKKLESNK